MEEYAPDRASGGPTIRVTRSRWGRVTWGVLSIVCVDQMPDLYSIWISSHTGQRRRAPV